MFAHTSPFRPGPRYSASLVVPLRRPTADTRELVAAAVTGAQQIYREGYDLAKAGVLLMDLSPAAREQRELDLEDDGATPRREQLMAAMDKLNSRYGRGTVHAGSAGTSSQVKTWGMRQDRRTPNYTTAWAEVPIVRA